MHNFSCQTHRGLRSHIPRHTNHSILLNTAPKSLPLLYQLLSEWSPMCVSISTIFSMLLGSMRGEVILFSTARHTPSDVWIPMAVEPSWKKKSKWKLEQGRNSSKCPQAQPQKTYIYIHSPNHTLCKSPYPNTVNVTVQVKTLYRSLYIIQINAIYMHITYRLWWWTFTAAIQIQIKYCAILVIRTPSYLCMESYPYRNFILVKVLPSSN